MKLPPIPDRSPVVVADPLLVKKSGGFESLANAPWRMLDDWQKWFRGLAQAVNTAPQSPAQIALTTQSASVAQTSMVQVPSAGLYRVSWLLQITQAASTSSSIQVRFDWEGREQALSLSGAALTSNTLGAMQSGSFQLYADLTLVGVPVTLDYRTTYASVGATAMQYALNVVVEQMP